MIAVFCMVVVFDVARMARFQELFIPMLEGTGLAISTWYADDDELFADALVQPA